LLDTDNDGAPNECDQVCSDLGMTADNDDDNDGVLDINDQFSLIFSVSLDADLDALPDRWNEACDSACKLSSDLVIDEYLNDTDNDGLPNDFDTDNTADNGLPEMLSIPSNINVAVNSKDGASAELEYSEAELLAFDVVDTHFTYKAFVQGQALIINDGVYSLPAGINELDWVAIDSSGNVSEALTQIVKVYPRLQFETPESITGDGGQVSVKVILSGDSPIYPVNLKWFVDSALSDTVATDFDAAFDPSSDNQSSIVEPADGALPFVNILIPLANNDVIENDEMVILKLIKDELFERLIIIDADKSQHSVLITHDNLAPTVKLELMQNGVEVANVSQLGGDISIKAIINDPNIDDAHSLEWDLEELNLMSPVGNVLRFNPVDLDAGEYSIKVTVTDDGLEPMSSEDTLVLKVVEPDVDELKEQLGALYWLLLALTLPLCIRRSRV